MKKQIKLIALAVVAMATATACNNPAPADEVIDTVVPVDTIVEEIIDSTAIEEVVVDEPVAPAKKATTKKKAEVKKSTNDRPTEITVKKEIKKRTSEDTKNLQTSTKETKPTDRPTEIKVKTNIGKRNVNVTVQE